MLHPEKFESSSTKENTASQLGTVEWSHRRNDFKTVGALHLVERLWETNWHPSLRRHQVVLVMLHQWGIKIRYKYHQERIRTYHSILQPDSQNKWSKDEVYWKW